MLSEGTRRFDLYDFFSIFMPGATFVLGLLPFTPEDTSVFSPALLIVLLVGGIIFGRAIHASTLLLQDSIGTESHRGKFEDEVLTPDYVSEELANQFYNHCVDCFSELDLPGSREDLTDQDHSDDIEALYGLVRSYIHMDARGRSRTFQAIYDFYQAMWMTSVYLVFIYVAYAVLVDRSNITEETVGYTSYLGSLGMEPWVIFFGAGAVLGSAYITFKKMRSNYREYFVQYVFSDFIILQTDNT